MYRWICICAVSRRAAVLVVSLQILCAKFSVQWGMKNGQKRPPLWEKVYRRRGKCVDLFPRCRRGQRRRNARFTQFRPKVYKLSSTSAQMAKKTNYVTCCSEMHNYICKSSCYLVWKEILLYFGMLFLRIIFVSRSLVKILFLHCDKSPNLATISVTLPSSQIYNGPGWLPKCQTAPRHRLARASIKRT